MDVMPECNLALMPLSDSYVNMHFVNTLERVIGGTLAVLLLVVAIQSVVPKTYVPRPKEPVVEVPCKGNPIKVDFAYSGTVNDPWTCKVQCDDDKPRYILYSNGKATQCETPPGCNDSGEDNGITCTAPGTSAGA